MSTLPLYNPSDASAPSPYQLGNFCPIRHAGTYLDLKVEGTIPEDLDGIYLRNGTNQLHLPPTGVMHMFDGDAMLHCVRFEKGKPLYYANTWIQSDRAKANAAPRKELYTTFGDLTGGGQQIKEKLVNMTKAMTSGTIPNLGKNRSHPSTSTLYVGGKLFCLVEVCPPFQVSIDPETGRVESGNFDDMDGKIEAFTAHPKSDSKSEQVFWFGLPKYTSIGKANAHYGALSAEGDFLFRHDFPVEKPFPAFLHDYFITKNFAIVVDHSLRMDTSRVADGSAFLFDSQKNIRFGILPRFPEATDKVRWFDTGRCGFVWHVVNGWEEDTNSDQGKEKKSQSDSGKVVLFLNIFDYYPDSVPIHVAEEPPSHLWRYEIDVEMGRISGEKVLDSVATERNDYNRHKTGCPTKYAYLMKRGEGREMYDGFVKYDLEALKVEATVEYGEERFGGEALFVPKEGKTNEDDGYLVDIVYDGKSGGSELCIWNAAKLKGDQDPVARVHLPHRVPYGVHANWLSTKELYRQHEWFKRASNAQNH